MILMVMWWPLKRFFRLKLNEICAYRSISGKLNLQMRRNAVLRRTRPFAWSMWLIPDLPHVFVFVLYNSRLVCCSVRGWKRPGLRSGTSRGRSHYAHQQRTRARIGSHRRLGAHVQKQEQGMPSTIRRCRYAPTEAQVLKPPSNVCWRLRGLSKLC